MKTTLIQVSPAMAREWLKRNTANRVLRPLRVAEFKAAWSRGEWKLTHQGIAFGRDGVLKDGQHRLHFIASLPENESVQMLVSEDVDNDTFGVIDVGTRRSSFDELHIDKSLAAVAHFLAKLYNGGQGMGITTPYLVPFVEWAQVGYEDLIAFCNTRRAIWSSAPVMTAAIVQMARGHNADFIKSTYRALVLRDTTAMTPVAGALFKQVIDGKAGSARSLDLFIRALRVFNSQLTSAVQRIQVTDSAASIADVRSFLNATIDAPRIDSSAIKAAAKKSPRSAGLKLTSRV